MSGKGVVQAPIVLLTDGDAIEFDGVESLLDLWGITTNDNTNNHKYKNYGR